MISLAPYHERLAKIETCRWTGNVTELVGLLVESNGPAAAIGDFCEIGTKEGRLIRTQVIGFRDGRVLSMPLEETDGLHLGDPITARKEDARMEAGPELLGRVIDGFGKPLDNLGPIGAKEPYDLYAAAPGPLDREPISEPLVTGIRAIDSLLTCGKGQRIGIFGGSGVGKSTLLGAMARSSDADVSVIALIGERNREVRDFIEQDLGPEGLKKSVLVVATSDRPAPLRIRAAFVALAVAEYFRDQGKDVLLVMDSVTRLAMAQREIGLAAGEPPSQKGYTPSVFHLMPKIFERAGHYPAIDVLQSVSRLAPRLYTAEQKEAAAKVREAMATHARSEDLINLGAYASGANPKLDAAIRLRPRLLDFLKQAGDEG